ncbi:hypothetical protein M514_05732 [Trichuris suis]|uniref:Cdc23 domain-containing protein n=1 Tax=Trichuris suis TaxID=68888 RepID=A0A085NAK4_9BILA|nr:hypothetical protein M513_05732 [Trichuris suis]KFD66500.1 hypothetical protein M514_05732 [Trichuris suis]
MEKAQTFQAYAAQAHFIDEMRMKTRAVAAREARLWDHFRTESAAAVINPDNVCAMLADLCRAYNDCMLRRLVDFAERIMETLFHWAQSFPEIEIELCWLPSGEAIATCGGINVEPSVDDVTDSCWYSICFLHALFDEGCVKRAAMLKKRDKGPIVDFLHLYARYLSIEGCRWTVMDSAEKRQFTDEPMRKCFVKGAQQLARLRDDIEILRSSNGLDPYLLFLYGKVLSQLGMVKAAAEAFRKAVVEMPYCWPAWQELAKILDDTFDVIELPDCWMKLLFAIDYYMNRQLPHGAIKALTLFKGTGAMKTPVFIFQAARICISVRELYRALKLYRKMTKLDHYCVWCMDMFASVLSIRRPQALKEELAALSNRCFEANPESPLALVVWGITISSFRSHDKAVRYFQRALEMNPLYSEAWVLLGNELILVKNLNGAEFAFCQGLAVDPTDTRLYYGLGEVCSQAGKPEFAIYWYSMAIKTKRHSTRAVLYLLQQLTLMKRTHHGRRLMRKCNIPYSDEYIAQLKQRCDIFLN